MVQSIVNYDRDQFQLFVAMGAPPPLDQPSDPSSPPVSIPVLTAPVTASDPARRPAEGAPNPVQLAPGPGPATATDPARRDGPVPPDGPAPALAAAESGIAQTLERLRRDGGKLGADLDPFANLAKAHQKSMNALLDYDRLQEKLFRTLDAKPGTGTAAEAEPVDLLMDLAEAHRKLMKSKVDYDQTLWEMFRALKAKAKPKAPAEPSMARREPKDAAATTK
jgi:hypothetical protein